MPFSELVAIALVQGHPIRLKVLGPYTEFGCSRSVKTRRLKPGGYTDEAVPERAKSENRLLPTGFGIIRNFARLISL
jgi:hypothetical protein